MSATEIGRIDARGDYHCCECEGYQRCAHPLLATDRVVHLGHGFRDTSARCVDCGLHADAITGYERTARVEAADGDEDEAQALLGVER